MNLNELFPGKWFLYNSYLTTDDGRVQEFLMRKAQAPNGWTPQTLIEEWNRQGELAYARYPQQGKWTYELLR